MAITYLDIVENKIKDYFGHNRVLYKYGNIDTMRGFIEGSLLLSKSNYYKNEAEKEIQNDECYRKFHKGKEFLEKTGSNIAYTGDWIDKNDYSKGMDPNTMNPVKILSYEQHDLLPEHYLLCFSTYFNAHLIEWFPKSYNHVLVLEKNYIYNRAIEIENILSNQFNHKFELTRAPVIYFDYNNPIHINAYNKDQDLRDTIKLIENGMGYFAQPPNKHIEQEYKLVWVPIPKKEIKFKRISFNIDPPKKFMVIWVPNHFIEKARKTKWLNFEVAYYDNWKDAPFLQYEN